MTRCAVLALLGLLAGCIAPGTAPDTPEQRAMAVIGASLVGTAPQRLMPAIARCAIDQATEAEEDILQSVIDLAPNATTKRISRTIIRRPDTQTCLNANGIVMVKR